MMTEQYACPECEFTLKYVDTFTTIKTAGFLKGNKIMEDVDAFDAHDDHIITTFSCPYCKAELPPTEFTS